MLLPIFLISQFNRHGGDSDLSYLIFSLFCQHFRVKFSSLDSAAYSEPSSDRCTRALVSCMDNLNFKITTASKCAYLSSLGQQVYALSSSGIFRPFLPLKIVFSRQIRPIHIVFMASSHDSLLKGLVATSIKLIGKNYQLWSQAFETYLGSH